MRHYGDGTGSLRRLEQYVSAGREFTSPIIYRMPLTQFEAGKAKAGQFYMPLSGPNNQSIPNSPLITIAVAGLLWHFMFNK